MALPPDAGALGTPSALSSLGGSRLILYLGRDPKEKKKDRDPPPEAGRDTHEAIVVCKSPDVCKTPVGAATPPVPYQITSKMGDDVNTAPSVRLTKLRAFKFDSHTTHVTGDEPGTAKGVKSGTVGDIAEPKTHSATVKTEGQWLIRDGDEFWMNRRNTVGEAIYKKNRNKAPPEDLVRGQIDDSEAEALIAKAVASGAQIEHIQTEETKTKSAWVQRQNMPSEPVQLAFFDEKKAGTLTDAPVKRDPLPTNNRFPKGAPGRGAGPIVGVLLLDQLAKAGELNRMKRLDSGLKEQGVNIDWSNPEHVAALKEYSDNLGGTSFIRRNFFPPMSEDQALERLKSRLKADEERRQREEEEKKEPEPAQPDPGSGGRITGDPCDIKPYKEGCPDGQDAHHVVKDMVLRYGVRGDSANRIPGAPSLNDGPSMCLTKDEHKKVHQLMDQKIRDLGNRTDNGPKGTAPIQDIIDLAIDALGEVKKECKGKFEKKVRDAFKDLKDGTLGRTQNKPFVKPGQTMDAPF